MKLLMHVAKQLVVTGLELFEVSGCRMRAGTESHSVVKGILTVSRAQL